MVSENKNHKSEKLMKNIKSMSAVLGLSLVLASGVSAGFTKWQSFKAGFANKFTEGKRLNTTAQVTSFGVGFGAGVPLGILVCKKMGIPVSSPKGKSLIAGISSVGAFAGLGIYEGGKALAKKVWKKSTRKQSD